MSSAGGLAVVDFPNQGAPNVPGNIYLFVSESDTIQNTPISSVQVYEATGTPPASGAFDAPFQYSLDPNLTLTTTTPGATTGQAFTVSWSSTGLSSGTQCQLFDNNNATLTTGGTTGSYSGTVPSVTPYSVIIQCGSTPGTISTSFIQFNNYSE